jgi:hypothetical protein
MSGLITRFTVVYAELEPISVNAAYTTFRGRQHLTAEGKAFKAGLSAAVARELPVDWGFYANRIFETRAWVRLEIGIHRNILVKSWEPSPREKRQMPYQRLDGPNYQKLIEDAVAHATGIDDCAHLSVSVFKEQSADPFISITYELMEDRHGQ